MFRTPSGEDVLIVDTHVHLWDASPANWRNTTYAEGWINCFYDYHRNLSPPEYVWPLELYQKYGDERMAADLFDKGYVDVGILQPTYLKDFYTNGFNTVDSQAFLTEKYPGRFILNGRFDPRDGDEGLKSFEEEVKRYNLKGVKLYTAEWQGDSRGWRLDDAAARPYFDTCAELGVVNIHVHKGPTIWPLTRDAFDVSDVDSVATDYRDTGLRFIVEHCGLPRLDDFCWIAVQEPNVYAGLAVVMPFIHARPYYFAEVLAELLWWVGEDRMMWSSDYALWEPKWLVEKFWEFELPDEVKEKTGVELTEEAKKKILGLNAAKLYDLPVPAVA